MRHTFTLGRLFGIPVRLHVSWLFVYVFMTLSIAANIAGVARAIALALAAMCAGLLFVSVVAHECAHALVARRYAVRTREITLFIFGGVASLECEPPTPRAEVLIALAGPVMSALIAGLAFGLLVLLEHAASGAVGQAVGLIVAYLALANGVLAVFNLVPAFPMDGGRVLRAVIWRARRSRAAATGAASIAGLIVAVAFVGAGLFSALGLHAWRESWYVLIGVFLLRQGWVQLSESRVCERLERVHVCDVMEIATAEDIAVDGFSLAPSATALDAVRAFRASSRMRIAVMDGGQLAGWLGRERTLAVFGRAA